MRQDTQSRSRDYLLSNDDQLVLCTLCYCAGYEPSRTRTCDPLVKSQLLYQLSYRPIHAESTLRRALFNCEELETHSSRFKVGVH